MILLQVHCILSIESIGIWVRGCHKPTIVGAKLLMASLSVVIPVMFCSTIKVYSVIITSDSDIVMHLVPVPAGLQIGDYTVPSNGMFDIVSQKFYGNSGTGEFEFGTDY